MGTARKPKAKARPTPDVRELRERAAEALRDPKLLPANATATARTAATEWAIRCIVEIRRDAHALGWCSATAAYRTVFRMVRDWLVSECGIPWNNALAMPVARIAAKLHRAAGLDTDRRRVAELWEPSNLPEWAARIAAMNHGGLTGDELTLGHVLNLFAAVPRQTKAGANRGPVVLSDDAVAILRYLRDRGTWTKQLSIASEVRRDEKTIRGLLRELRDLGFTTQRGKTGEGITDGGREYLTRLPG